MAFQVVELKNCRHLIKKCYTLDQCIDDKLLHKLEIYGILQMMRFSAFSPLAKDCFRIQFEDSLDITGVMGDTELFITIRKANIDILTQIESILV